MKFIMLSAGLVLVAAILGLASLVWIAPLDVSNAADASRSADHATALHQAATMLHPLAFGVLGALIGAAAAIAPFGALTK